MRQCEFCSAPLPEGASYCGVCLHVPWPKTITNDPQWENNPGATGVQNTAMPAAGEDEDEEWKRRAALAGSGVPIFGVWGQPQGTVPVVQGTPQMPGVPTVAGTPSMPGPGIQPSTLPQAPGSPGTGAHPMPGMNPPPFPQTYGSTFPGTQTLPGQPTHPLHPSHSPHSSHPPRAHHRLRGCTLRLIIIAIAIPILIIASIISLGLTIWQPGLSLSGSSSVASGGTLVIHGSSFMPGSSVTLTLDGGMPVYFATRSVPRQMARNANATGAMADASALALASSTSNSVSAGIDGSFTVTIPVNPAWQPGKHTIHAIESLSHRSASLDFSILQNGTTTPGTTPSPQSGTSTATTTPSSSPTGTTTATPSPTTKTGTATPASLSCLNPGTLNLGPVMQASTQLVSGQVTLCATGTGTINWSATLNAAPWLKLAQTGGQIVAPGKTVVTISASAANLTPGNYNATITFNGQPGNSIQRLNVSFIVSIAPPCVTASPTSLNFSGVAGLSDPPGSQTITVKNCGAIPGTWSATIAVGSGGNWLTINPTSSALNAGASTAMAAIASNLNVGLGAGSYSDTVTISIGTSTVSIPVTLTVQAAPQISVTPTSIFADRDPQCQLVNQWTCFVTLTNSSNTVALNWTGSSSGLSGVTITPGASTIPPSQTEQVQITLPNFCENTVTLTFQGPVNAATVTWTCAA